MKVSRLPSIPSFTKASAIFFSLALTASTQAGLLHYYADTNLDNTNITVDRVGTANGTTYGTGTYVNDNGLYTDGSNGGLVGGVPSNGMLLDSSAVAGITGSFSLNQWFTGTGNGFQSWLFGFSDGTSANMLAMLEVDNWWPQYPSHAYTGVGGGYTDLWGNGFDNGTAIPDDPFYGSWLDDGNTHMVTLTYDMTSLSLYVDTQLAGAASLSGFDLSILTTAVIGGGSPWAAADRAANADTHAFGIFDQSLAGDQVTAMYALGRHATVSDLNAVVPEPSTFALLAGFVALGAMILHRRKQ